jgi:hypothetical protein
MMLDKMSQDKRNVVAARFGPDFVSNGNINDACRNRAAELLYLSPYSVVRTAYARAAIILDKTPVPAAEKPMPLLA